MTAPSLNNQLHASKRSGIRKALSFSGRATPKEFWTFYISFFVPLLLFSVFSRVMQKSGNGSVMDFAIVIYLIVFALPVMAAMTRRFHDTGVTGWLTALQVLPLVLLVLGLVYVEKNYPVPQLELSETLSSTELFLKTIEQMNTPEARTSANASAFVVTTSLVLFLILHMLTLFWMSRPSQPGSNPYGPNPHEVPS